MLKFFIFILAIVNGYYIYKSIDSAFTAFNAALLSFTNELQLTVIFNLGFSIVLMLLQFMFTVILFQDEIMIVQDADNETKN